MAETYAAWRIREQAENPDPERCGHGVPLRRRCPGCEDSIEQNRRWAALDASVPCAHTIPGTCDYC